MFSSMVANAAIVELISSGTGGTRNEILQVVCFASVCLVYAIFFSNLLGNAFQMVAEVQLLSPLVPARQLTFARFCKQHAEGVWVVVDVSVDINRNAGNSHPLMSCRKLPSGCVIQDLPNGFSRVSNGGSIFKKYFWSSLFYLV